MKRTLGNADLHALETFIANLREADAHLLLCLQRLSRGECGETEALEACVERNYANRVLVLRLSEHLDPRAHGRLTDRPGESTRPRGVPNPDGTQG